MDTFLALRSLFLIVLGNQTNLYHGRPINPNSNKFRIIFFIIFLQNLNNKLSTNVFRNIGLRLQESQLQ